MSDDRTRNLEAALSFLENGQNQKAMDIYFNLASANPLDMEALHHLANLQNKLMMRTEAAETFFRLGVALTQTGNQLRAISAFNTVLKLEPETIDANVQLANHYLEMGMSEDAKPHLEKLAAYHEGQGSTEELINIYQRLVDIDPKSVASRVKLGEHFSTVQRITDAATQFAAAGKELKAQGRLDDYVMVMERLIYHDQSSVDSILELANIYLQLGKPMKALPKLRMAYEIAPSNLDTLEMLAMTFTATGKGAKAILTYKAMVQLFAEQGAMDMVQRRYSQILAIDPDDEDGLRFSQGA